MADDDKLTRRLREHPERTRCPECHAEGSVDPDLGAGPDQRVECRVCQRARYKLAVFARSWDATHDEPDDRDEHALVEASRRLRRRRLALLDPPGEQTSLFDS